MAELVTGHLLIYLFVLVRITAILFAMPLWSGRLPLVWKMSAALWLSVLFTLIVPVTAVPERMTLAMLVAGIGREFLVGALMGLLVRLFIGAVTLAGQLAGYQMGLAIANVIDPATSARYSIVAQWLNLLALFTFLEMNGHLVAVRLLAESFLWIPPFSARVSPDLCYDLVRSGGDTMWRIALTIGWPISLALLLIYLAMALLARVAPQINMLMVGFPITISIGLIILWVGVPSFTVAIERTFQEAFRVLERILAAVGA